MPKRRNRRSDTSHRAHGEWFFPDRNGGIEYVQEPSSGYFRDAPIPKLVREVIQNAVDARRVELREPVHVDFHETMVPSEHIGGAALCKHVSACHERVKNPTSPSRVAAQIYERAVAALEQPAIRCLSVIDTNTTGLQDNKWKALVLQEGAVCKPDVIAPGGSNGIGKNAVFNVSDIRTVFYSTRYLGAKGRVMKAQGKATLMAHTLPGTTTDLQHIGFYQSRTGGALEGTSVPECFQLNDTGTAVFILGFNPRSADWVSEVAGAVVKNFFDAIHSKRLIVQVHPHELPVVSISHETVDHLFQQHAGTENDAYFYYQARRDEDPLRTKELPRLGSLNVYTRLEPADGRPRRIAYVNRNGMLITDSREAKTNPIAPRGRTLWPDYAVVVVPDSDAGDAWVRGMEIRATTP